MPPPSVGSAEERRARQQERNLLSTSASHNLGLVLHNLGKVDEALGHICRALAGFELSHGSKSVNALKALHNVAMVTASSGDLERAGELYRTAFELRREVLGPDALDTLRTACNRGLCLHQAEPTLHSPPGPAPPTPLAPPLGSSLAWHCPTRYAPP